MKIVVISEETRLRMLGENPLLDDIDSSQTKKEKEKERELERKKKEQEELERKKKEQLELEKKNQEKKETTNNDGVTKTETDSTEKNGGKTDSTEKDSEVKTDNTKKDSEVKTDNTKKSNYVQVTQKMLDDKLKADKEKENKKTETPPKPTNPSGKIIPKPKKPLMKNSPAAKAGIPIETRQKFANMNAAFQATKRKDSGYTKMDFIKDFPSSQTAKKFNKGERIPGFKYPKNKKVKTEVPNIKDMSAVSNTKEVTIDDFKNKKEDIKSSYEPYHIVLGYLLHEGHAETINEAHYVMTQMDTDTIQEIVALDEMGVANKIATGAALTLGGMGLNAIRKQLQNKKKMENDGEFRKNSMMDNIQKKNKMLKDLDSGNY